MSTVHRVGLLLALSACVPAAAPPAPPAHPPASPESAPAAAPAAPALPWARDFVKVALPADVGAIQSISGRDREAWLLDEDGVLLRLEGGRVAGRYQPRKCFDSVSFQWVGVRAERDGLRLAGSVQAPGANQISATYDPIKNVVGECRATEGPDAFDCPWFHVWGAGGVLDGRQCSLGKIKLPDYDPFIADPEKRVQLQLFGWGVQMRGKRDGWMVADVGAGGAERVEVHRYDGVTWTRIAVLPAPSAFDDLWSDDAGHAWLLARPAGVRRFAGRTMSAVPLAEGFAAERLAASGPDRAWFFGVEKKIFESDGASMRAGEAPFVPTRAWAEPGGELWLAGEKKGELVRTSAQAVSP
jgi:hypothetical protein